MLTNLTLAASFAILGSGPSASVPVSPAAATTFAVSSTRADDLPKAASAVSIKTEDKLLLKATYFAPKKSRSNSKAPAALLIHDASQTREELEELAAYLHKRGFAVLTLDLRGHGDSATKELDFEKSSAKDQKKIWDLAGRDVEAAADYLVSQNGVHSSNLSIIGFGAGAALAVRRAATDENVRSLVLVEPELETFEYDVSKGVMKLDGLPTMIVSSKDGKKTAKKIQSEAHDACDGLEFIDITEVKCEVKKMPSDKKTRSATGAWLRDQAMPKR